MASDWPRTFLQPGCFCSAYSVTIRISAQNNFMLLLKHFITKVLEYKEGLTRIIKFVCVALCSLVMSLCSHDLHVMLLNNITIHGIAVD